MSAGRTGVQRQATPRPRQVPWQRALLHRALAPGISAVLLCAVYIIALDPFVPVLLSSNNVLNVVSNVWPLLTVAIGQMLVLIVAGIDLSQPAVIALSCVVSGLLVTSGVNPDLFGQTMPWGWLINESGGPLHAAPFATACAFIVSMVVGALVGLINGLSITRLRMPPFMVTLVTATLFGAVAVWLTKSENVINLPPAWLALVGVGFGPVTAAAVLAVVLCAATHVMLTRTLLGRWMYACGANPVAAKISGVPVAAVTTAAYVLSGVFASLGGMIYTARLQVARPTTGADLLLDIIGATVIGGTSLFGGSGRVLWTCFGVLLFCVIANSLNLLNLEFNMVYLVKGAVIALAALMDVARARWGRSEA